jgi:histidine triad (HIT) family protein
LSNDFYCNEVLSGRTPVEKVVETATVLAFYHTKPSYPVHIVVIPKKHIASLTDMQPEDAPLLVEMMATIQQVARQVLETHGACRVITNLGAYQDSKHLHWHVIAGEMIKHDP